MNVIYSDEAIISLRDSMQFYITELEMPLGKVIEIQDYVFERGDSLGLNPNMGSEEEYLVHLGKGHQRIIAGYFKIIYLILKDEVYVTDIFDTRQDPEKMKG